MVLRIIMYLKKQQSEVVMSQAVMVVTSPVTNFRRECTNGKRFHMVNCYSLSAAVRSLPATKQQQDYRTEQLFLRIKVSTFSDAVV